eukprot:2145989-Amphidinium_carterae.1
MRSSETLSQCRRLQVSMLSGSQIGTNIRMPVAKPSAAVSERCAFIQCNSNPGLISASAQISRSRCLPMGNR